MFRSEFYVCMEGVDDTDACRLQWCSACFYDMHCSAPHPHTRFLRVDSNGYHIAVSRPAPPVQIRQELWSLHSIPVLPATLASGVCPAILQLLTLEQAELHVKECPDTTLQHACAVCGSEFYAESLPAARPNCPKLHGEITFSEQKGVIGGPFRFCASCLLQSATFAKPAFNNTAYFGDVAISPCTACRAERYISQWSSEFERAFAIAHQRWHAHESKDGYLRWPEAAHEFAAEAGLPLDSLLVRHPDSGEPTRTWADFVQCALDGLKLLHRQEWIREIATMTAARF
jgi:hypothetical protein